MEERLSFEIAECVVDALIDVGLIQKDDLAKAIEIVDEEVACRLALHGQSN